MELKLLCLAAVLSVAAHAQLIPTQPRPQIVTNGLCAYLPLGEGAGSTGNDASGNGHNGTWHGTQTGSSGYYSAGQGVNAFSGAFDGTTDYVGIGNVCNIADGPITMQVWIKPPASNQYGAVISKRINSAPYSQYDLSVGYFNSSGAAVSALSIGCFFANPGTDRQSVHTNNSVANGAWHNVACARGASGTNQIAIYVDTMIQALTADNVNNNPNVSNTISLDIGWDNGTGYYTGSVSGVLIYTRQLSQAEIQQNFYATTYVTAPPCPLTTTASLSGYTLGYASPVGDANNGDKLVSWVTPSWYTSPSNTFACTAWYNYLLPVSNFYLSGMPTDGLGNPMDYDYSQASITDPPVGVTYQQLVSGYLAPVIQNALAWKLLTGSSALITRAITLAAFVLAQGLTSSGANWPSVPYSASHSATNPYDGYEPQSGGTTGLLEPDKLAWLGYAFVQLYQATGTTEWLTQAEHYADVLVDHQITSPTSSASPWPFRVVASTGGAAPGNNAYTANEINMVRLFDILISNNWHGAHSIADYTASRTAAWNWIVTYPVANGNWDNCYEDIVGAVPGGDFCANIPLDVATYYLQNPSVDPVNGLTNAETLSALVASTIGSTSFTATVIGEQAAYTFTTTDATSQFAFVQALLAQATTGSTSAAYQDASLRSMNWCTYALSAISGGTAGQVAVGMNLTEPYSPIVPQWWRTSLATATYMMWTIQAFPQWGSLYVFPY